MKSPLVFDKYSSSMDAETPVSKGRLKSVDEL
jgi:hypothetical protein